MLTLLVVVGADHYGDSKGLLRWVLGVMHVCDMNVSCM